MLGLIAVSRGEGLTTRQLTDIMSKDIRAALRASKQYLSGDTPDGPFRPFHKSFNDVLLGRVDGFDQDESECESHEGAVVLRGFLAS